jgi:Trypsin-like peptidase domain
MEVSLWKVAGLKWWIDQAWLLLLKRLVLMIASLIAIQSASAQSQQLGTSKDISASVVKVWATGCPLQQKRVGSGFVWNNNMTIVTSLHVVIGCTTLSVEYYGINIRRNATFRLASLKHDIALLTVPSNPSSPPLVSVSMSLPKRELSVLSWGYPKNTGKLRDTGTRIRLTQGKLRDILDSETAKALVSAGTPSVDNDVLSIEGHVLPGESGGPLVDSAGVVVGIIDGGLDSGQVEINWAISAYNLLDKNSFSDKIPNEASIALRLAPRFSANVLDDLDDSSGSVLDCGSFELVKIKNRDLADLAGSTDDPRGLQNILRFAKFNAADYNTKPITRFNIYRHVESGATVVIPAGSDISESESGDMCVASSFDGVVKLYIQVIEYVAEAEVGASAQAYTLGVQELAGLGFENWFIDPNFTYPAPLLKKDGLSIYRRGIQQGRLESGVMFLGSYMYQTLAYREKTLFGVSVVRQDFPPELLDIQSRCLAGAKLDECPQVFQDLSDITQYIVATHLGTFTRY